MRALRCSQSSTAVFRAWPQPAIQSSRLRSARKERVWPRSARHHTLRAAAMSDLSGETFFLDDFAFRQFDSGQIQTPKPDFVRQVHELYLQGRSLVDGYAPFCKHLFVPNFAGATVNALEITDDNQQHLRTAYSRRRPDELAVLTRYFPANKVSGHPAKYLDLILYSREQIEKEHDALPEKGAAQGSTEAPWGIISIKPQDEDFETPMQPITMMRNALGRDEGGSGVPLDKEQYEASVAFWQNRAPIVTGNPNGE